MTTSGTLEQAVTLADVVSVVRARRVALPPEVAGYLALEVASEGLTRLAGANGTNTAIPDPTRIFLSHEGTVGIVSTPSAFREGDLEAFVRGFLGTLFDAAGSSTPALAAVATSTSLRSLESLRHELSSALIPVNRAAGRRALARVSREVRRVISGVGRNQNVESFTPPQGPVSHLPDEDDVHTTRKTIPPGLLVQAYPSSSMPSAEDHGSGRLTVQMPVAEAVGSDGSSVDELIESFGKTSRASEVPVSDELKSIAGVMQTPGPGRVGNITVVVGDDGPLVRIGGTDSRLMPTIPSRHRARQFSRPDHTQKKWVFGIASVVFVGLSALGFGYQMLKSPHDSFLRRRARHTDSNDGKTALNAVCSASVTLKDCPPESEVLLYLGTAPLDVPRMPVGTRLEFVATLEGHAPRRVVITKDANWDTTPDGKPKYELAMQLDNGPLATNWPAGEPGSEVGGQGPPGLVHIVTTPRAAQIWLVAGLGPEARIEQLPCEDSLKFLVAGPTSFRKTIDVMPDSFTESQVGATHRLRAAIVSAK